MSEFKWAVKGFEWSLAIEAELIISTVIILLLISWCNFFTLLVVNELT